MTAWADVLFSTSFIFIRIVIYFYCRIRIAWMLMKFFVYGVPIVGVDVNPKYSRTYIEYTSYDLLSCNIRKKSKGKNDRTCLARLSSLIWKSTSHINLNVSRTRACDTYSFVHLDFGVYFPKQKFCGCYSYLYNTPTGSGKQNICIQVTNS